MQPHNRILIVDDSPSIHDDFREILGSDGGDGLDELDELLFGPTESSKKPMSFAIDSAFQGQEALAMVQRAISEDKPYAVCFLDVRMPPGWDGPETLARLWEAAPELQVVLCTAYSDYSWPELLDRFGHTDRLLILKKPFEVPEVRQLAHALAEKWRLARDNRSRLEDLEARVAERTSELERVNRKLEREMAEREEMQHKLERGRRLEALGRLVAGIGHELNNPLSLVVGNLDLAVELLDEMSNTLPQSATSELGEILRTAQLGSERVVHIIHNIRAFVRPSAGDLKPVEVADAVAVAVQLVEQDRASHIELTVELGDIPPVMGHRIELEQVLRNLLSNALHALAATPAGRAHVRVTGRRDDDHVVIAVSDTGMGIDEAVLQNIFDPFFTTKTADQGTGLGLSLCHGMVTAMSGTIAVTSTPGGGTEVAVRLRAMPADFSAGIEPPASDRAPAPVADTRRTARILVIDDEPLIVKLMLRALRHHDVVGVTSGAAALRHCLDEDFDIVFCDLMMPDMTGMELYHELHELRPDLPDKIVFVTGGALIAETRQFLASVPNPRLEKPVTRDLVNEQVDRLLEQGRPAARTQVVIEKPDIGAKP